MRLGGGALPSTRSVGMGRLTTPRSPVLKSLCSLGGSGPVRIGLCEGDDRRGHGLGTRTRTFGCRPLRAGLRRSADAGTLGVESSDSTPLIARRGSRSRRSRIVWAMPGSPSTPTASFRSLRADAAICRTWRSVRAASAAIFGSRSGPNTIRAITTITMISPRPMSGTGPAYAGSQPVGGSEPRAPVLGGASAGRDLVARLPRTW